MMRRSTERQVALRNRRQRPSYVAATGALLLLVALLVIYIGVRSPYGVPGRDYGELQVQLADPSNLQIHDPVRVAGVRIGQVTAMKGGTGAARGQSVVSVKLDPGTEPLPQDTTIRLRAAGLLGARYIEVLPGRSDRTLPWGSTIRVGREAVSYGVTDVLDTFDERTRAGLDQMIIQFGRGLFTRGQGLNTAFRVVPEGEADFRRLAAAIRRRPGAAQRFIP
ncbi:MAG TPA: MlaD family protein, partial [Baekduia sp.]|nr:MlaD family protein [Baekduia sp.]